MDSVTQITLGAAIGEATLGRRLGNKAILWGAALGTLADLDVAFSGLFDTVDQLRWHRGYSHSLFLNAAITPLLAYGLYRLHKRKVDLRSWNIMVFLVLLAAVMIDAFTVYGTQLLQPFSDYPVGFNSISIVDPLFTVPLLVAVIWALFLKQTNPRRHRASVTGLAVASTYLLLTVLAKFYVNSVTERNFAAQGIQPSRYMTAPTLFNAVLWRVMGEVEDGYQVAYYSLLDRDHELEFTFIPRNDSLIDGLHGERAVKTLRWFSQDWYTAKLSRDTVLLTDLRFGELDVDLARPRQYIFTWALTPTGRPAPDSLTITQRDIEVANTGEVLSNLFTRLGGI